MGKVVFGLKVIAIIAAIAVVGLLVTRPGAVNPRVDNYFDSLNKALRAQGHARPQAVIDLDRLDHNLVLVSRRLAKPLSYRLVTKSLPSLDLIEYALKKTGTRKIMEFHAPYVVLMLRSLQPRVGELDILMGKPVPVEAARAAFERIPASEQKIREDYFAKVQWLIDSKTRLEEYLAFRQRLGTAVKSPLQVSIEIDIGLHRGGVRTTAELSELLKEIPKNSKYIKFSGFMGYDGHVGHVPVLVGSREGAMKREFDKTTEKYAEFVAFVKKEFPELFAANLTFNGGGSRTYAMFDATGPVNDIALGSAVLQPVDFDGPPDYDHMPAVFVATPVIKRIDDPLIPFLPAWAARLWGWWNPNRSVAFFVYGGNWARTTVYPEGLSVNPLYESYPNRNLLPNQELLNGSTQQFIRPGDYVFYRPHQSDMIFEFEKITLVRGGKVAGSWEPLPERF